MLRAVDCNGRIALFTFFGSVKNNSIWCYAAKTTHIPMLYFKGDEMPGKIMFSTTSGLRGMFAVMYDDDGPIQTGETCKNFQHCKNDAIAWAKSEYGNKWQEHTNLRDEI